MNILYVGNFAQIRSTEGYVADALEAEGCRVLRVQEDKYLPAEMIDLVQRRAPHGPTAFLFSKCELRGMAFREVQSDPYVLTNFLHDLRQKTSIGPIACWVFDLMRAEFSPTRYTWALAVSECCDRFFCTDSGLATDPNIKNGRLLRQGYPRPTDGVKIDTMRRVKYECDVAFLGEAYGPRKLWIRALGREFGNRFRWFRDGVHCDELFHLCRSAKIVVGPPYPNFPGYWSNRLYLTTGYGGLFAGPTVDGMLTEGWMNGEHYLNLPGNDHQETCERLRRYLEPANADTLDEIRRKGTELCRSQFTFRHRVRDLVRELETV